MGPYLDNEAWTQSVGKNLNLTPSSPWHPWLYDVDQVGGYRQDYDTSFAKAGFSFVTVRGGRHEVPETAPKQAFAMLTNFFAQATPSEARVQSRAEPSTGIQL